MAKETTFGGEGRRRWTEAEARAALAELARSGESELAFARRRGFSRQRLRYWRDQLGTATRAPAATTKPAFVAVAMPVAPGPATIEIRLGAVSMRVREDLDVDHVARLVDALVRVREC